MVFEELATYRSSSRSSSQPSAVLLPDPDLPDGISLPDVNTDDQTSDSDDSSDGPYIPDQIDLCPLCGVLFGDATSDADQRYTCDCCQRLLCGHLQRRFFCGHAPGYESFEFAETLDHCAECDFARCHQCYAALCEMSA